MKSKAVVNNNNNAVIYARYSSRSQRDVSIDQQINACEPFAKQQGLTIVDVYADHAMSGTNDRRPAFRKMIADAEAGGFGYVIVYMFERFARDRYYSIIYKKKLKDCGVSVLSVQESITADPAGVIMEALYEEMAEYYSKDLSRKIRRGLEFNATRCMVNGVLPYGYKLGANRKYEINEAEANIVREIFERFSAGEEIASILRSLDERQIKNRRGTKWSRSGITRLLKNERYRGIYIYTAASA